MTRFPFRCVALAAILTLAGCVPPAPAPVSEPQPRPAAPLPPPPPPVTQDWRDAPITAGGWVYRADSAGTSAVFGAAGAEAALIARCEPQGRRITLSVPGAAPASLGITTSSMRRSLPAAPLAGAPPRIGAILPSADPLLDAIAYSRGRFVVSVTGRAALYVPAWPEIARVLEDCRG